jgi:hypothetical protein
LRIQATQAGAGTNQYLIYLANDPLPFIGAKRNIRMDLWTLAGLEEYAGFVFLADDTGSLHCYGQTIRPSGTRGTWRFRIDAGVPLAGTTQTAISSTLPPGVWRTRILADKQVGAPPEYIYNAFGVGQSSQDSISNRQASYAAAPASWNNLNCLKWGLCVQIPSSNANGLVTRLDLAEIRIWTW